MTILVDRQSASSSVCLSPWKRDSGDVSAVACVNVCLYIHVSQYLTADSSRLMCCFDITDFAIHGYYTVIWRIDVS